MLEIIQLDLLKIVLMLDSMWTNYFLPRTKLFVIDNITKMPAN